LNQSDISLLRKHELKERLAKIRKAFDAELKAIQAAATKKVKHCLLTVSA